MNVISLTPMDAYKDTSHNEHDLKLFSSFTNTYTGGHVDDHVISFDELCLFLVALLTPYCAINLTFRGVVTLYVQVVFVRLSHFTMYVLR